MSRLVSRAENWETVYTSFQNINFAAFDYNTIKQSILDYIKLYFPEVFNDFIESSELITIIESFAYIAELIAYRLDVNAHENFLSTAERQDSILRLAKLVSYTADRPIPNRGLVKITSVSTTEGILDALGNNLTGKTVTWNDSTNANWKDQFTIIVNRILSQQIGTIHPSDRFQIQDVLFELYNLNITPLSSGVVPYNTTVNGTSVSMELVPITYDAALGIIERRPYNNANFSFVYAQDGLGDASETTGFLCYTKQGTLQRFRQIFDGITPSQHYEIPINSVNNTDIWINNVSPTTGVILDIPSLIPYKRDKSQGISGEWVEVDTANAQNVIFNTNPQRNKYEIETRANNRVRVIFGDGEFSDIPSGTFDLWVRTSLDQDITISQSAIINQPASFNYIDSIGNTQTFSFTFSLVNSLQNGSASETLEHIRNAAPSVYYAQDRMVNGADYNTFMLQDSSILKLRTINRTFSGDSQYMSWWDPTTTYANVKLFSDDGAIYYDQQYSTIQTPITNINNLVTTYIETLLSSTDIFLYVSSYGVPAAHYRRTFNSVELDRLLAGLTPPPVPSYVDIYYNIATWDWHAIQRINDPATVLATYGWPNSFIPNPLISIQQTTINPSSSTGNMYDVTRYVNRLIVHSPSTMFWNNNSGDAVIDYTTLNSKYDTIAILNANTNCNRSGVLSNTWNFNVIGQYIHDTGVDKGLPDITRLSIIPQDINGDGFPDYLNINDLGINPKGIANIIKPKLHVDLSNYTISSTGYIVTLPISYITSSQDITVQFADLSYAIQGVDWLEITNSAKYQVIEVGGNKNVTSSTGSFSVNGSYHAYITIDGIHNFSLAYTGNEIQTFGGLVNQLAASLVGYATVSFYNGNIKIVSTSTTINSSVNIQQVVNNDIFTNLLGFTMIFTPTLNIISNTILLTPLGGTNGFNNQIVYVSVNDYVYFVRPTVNDAWTLAPDSTVSITSYSVDKVLHPTPTNLWTRYIGRSGLNFGWFHITPDHYLTDPASSNIMDTYIIQKGYFLALKQWLNDPINYRKPDAPTPLDMRLAYNYLLDNRMLSDTIVLRPGNIKVLFGTNADPSLQANLLVIPNSNTMLTDNQIKTTIVVTVENFFDPTLWEFGETFYFSELSAAIHAALPVDISSVVLVPTYSTNHFGNLYQITAREDEIFYPDISVANIKIVTDYNDIVMRVNTGG